MSAPKPPVIALILNEDHFHALWEAMGAFVENEESDMVDGYKEEGDEDALRRYECAKRIVEACEARMCAEVADRPENKVRETSIVSLLTTPEPVLTLEGERAG